MKKTLLISASVLSFASFAQSPQTNKNLPPAGSTYAQMNILNYITHPAGGENVAWTFNTSSSNFNSESYRVLDASELTSGDLAKFPSANFIREVKYMGNFQKIDFESMNDSLFIPLGFRQSSGSYQTWQIGSLTFPINMKYGDSISYTAGGIKYKLKCDGYGTLSFNQGNYTDVLRMVLSRSNSQELSYRYYITRPYMHKVFEYTLSSGFASNKLAYSLPYSLPTSIENEHSEWANEVIYPNPTHDIVKVNAKSEILELIVYNSTMTPVLKALHSNQISFEGFEKGVYHISVKTANGTSNHKVVKF